MPSFRPSAHGWPFPDDYDCPAALIGLGRPVAPEFGLAGGMCWTALDRFLAGRRIARTTHAPGPEDALYAEFVLRLTNALAKDVIARASSAQRLPAEGRGRSLGHLSRSEWATARREMDAERPILLLLLRDTGPFADPTDSRFVLATRYDADADRAMVWTYDPRRPGDDAATLILDPGKGGEPFVGRLGREETVYGLLAVPYDRPAPPRLAAAFSPADERQRVGLEEDLAPVDLGSRALGLLARDTEGHLVFVRHDDEGWHRERPADRGGVGADFLFAGPPVSAGAWGGKPSAIVRGVNGHLLHLRKGSRGWTAEDLTDQPNTGLRFRIAGGPVVLSEGRHPVVAAVNGDGRLLRYSWSTVRGWSAESLSKESGADAGCRLDGPIAGVVDGSGRAHVLGRNEGGEFVHFHEEPDGRWRGARPGAARAEIRRLLLDGPPVPRRGGDGAIEVFARGVGGHLLRFRLADGGRWTGQDLTEDAAGGAPSLTLASEPCVAGDAAGRRHVLGRNADGEVVHFAGAPDGSWRAENLTTDRITIGALFRVEGQPAAVAGGRTVLLAARRGGELMLYRWHGDDWVAENLTVERGGRDGGPRIASDPVATATADAAHVLALSASGTLAHYRVEAPMAAQGAATGLGAIAAALPALSSFARGLIDRFRQPERAVGLRASPMRPAAEEAPREAGGRGDAGSAEAEAVRAGGSEAGRRERRAAAVDEPQEAGGAPADDAADTPAAAEPAAARPWGRPTSAPAPWHEEPAEDEADEAEHPPAPADPRRESPRAEPERDLLRAGSEWDGPRLMKDPEPRPADDWDLALRDVSEAHERALVDHADEVVDEEDPASARLFRASSPAGEAAGTPAATPEEGGPGRIDDADGASPRPGEATDPSGGTAPRAPSTESVPGRPLVDLSFLSDIVRAPGQDADDTAADEPIEEVAADGSAGPGGDPESPGPAARSQSPAPAPKSEPGATASPPSRSDPPPAKAGASAPQVPPPAGAAPASRPAGAATTAGAPDRPAGNGSARRSDPVPARSGGAGIAGATASASADEPVVDLEFLVTAGEYVGGAKPGDGMEGFLQFLEQG